MTRSIEAVMADVRASMAGRTGYEGREPPNDERMLAEIGRLRASTYAPHWVRVEDVPLEWEDGRWLMYYAPAYEGLPPLHGPVSYHPDAGWCVDELRQVSHLALFPEAKTVTIGDVPAAR